MFKINTMALAITAATLASTSASAGIYYIEMSGSAQTNAVVIDQTMILRPLTQGPPRVDEPAALRTVDEGGSGWPGILKAAIDTDTGEVTEWSIEMQSDHLFSADNAQQYDIRTKGRTIVPSNGVFNDGSYKVPCAVGDSVTAIPGTAIADLLDQYPRPDVVPSTETLHVIHCPTVAAGPYWFPDGQGGLTGEFTQIPGSIYAGIDPAQGFLCATEDPTSVIPGENGCSGGWGDPFGIAGAAGGVADVPYICGEDPDGPPQGGSTGLAPAIAYDFGTCNGAAPDGTDVFTNFAPNQNLHAHATHEYQWIHGGGTWYFSHTGSFDTNDFQVSSVQLVLDVNVDYPIPAAGAGVGGSAQSYQTWVFDTMLNESDELLGKNVPAMGAFGLAALFGGLIAVAARLRRRVA
jgi:hypothetical protein